MQALRASGHEVRVVSTFRAYEGNGDAATQGRLRRRAARVAERLLTGKLERWRPDLWFTYHLHHKAPDWVGGVVARRLAIPYVVAEPSYAPRRARGRWDEGLAAVAASLKQADAVFLLNFTFLGGEAPPCRAACDANGDGDTGSVTDAVVILNFFFLGGGPPAAPYPACGPGALPSDARLGCGTPPACP